ncbi:MAG: RNA-binding S4 domain-containing protein [Bacteroidales bacterium]|jgi:ribosome-associated heat shock protein Hsp15|nr:RNA-binding S4 domain-containing protein [Bacteroidales bacterium]MCI2121357.1 RNA-binding S4 domain-containing protein [Bacteroidales bacterium]MCI2145242.1 RNA-binding S4 domain-containing protein [Bacteroidales bacterium]
MEPPEETRIDKFLWAIRVYKTRTEATDACKGGKVKVNGTEAKPSRAVRTGDTITVRNGSAHFTYRVIVPMDKRQGAQTVPLYAKNLTPESEIEKLRAPKETFFIKRDAGAGRPTKKERRQLDRLWKDIGTDGDYDGEDDR